MAIENFTEHTGPQLSRVESLYWDLVEELGGDEEIAMHLVLDNVPEETLRKLIADVKERLGD